MLRRYSSFHMEFRHDTDSFGTTTMISYNESKSTHDDNHSSDDHSNEFAATSYPETCSSSSFTNGYLEQEEEEEEEKEERKEKHVLPRDQDDDDDDDGSWADFEGLELYNCHPLEMVHCEEINVKTKESEAAEEEDEFVIRNDPSFMRLSFFETMLHYEPCVGRDDMASVVLSEENDHDSLEYDNDHPIDRCNVTGDNLHETMLLDHSSTFTSLDGNDGHDNMNDRLSLQTKWYRCFFRNRIGNVSMQDVSVDIDIDAFHIDSATSFSSLSSLEDHESYYNKRERKRCIRDIDKVIEHCKETSRKKRFGCLSRLLKPYKSV
jgi:hypothetical protein